MCVCVCCLVLFPGRCRNLLPVRRFRPPWKVVRMDCRRVLSLLSVVSAVFAYNLAPYLKEIGGTFCIYLAYKNQIPRSWFRDCAQPTCGWDDWNDALNKSAVGPVKKQRVVLSYSHNGFGNQLWEHTIAFMVAESLKARLLIATIPDNLCFDGATPPNTFAGMNAMERLLPDEFKYDALPQDAPERKLCDQESFFLSDRPRDWRNHNYSSHFKENIHEILSSEKPKCVKMLGYFQNYPMCAEDARRLWTPKMFGNFTKKPGPNDISIYLRCLPRHYHFNDKHFYETILNNTKFDKVWLFQAPECPTRLGDNPSRDGLVPSVLRLLRDRYNASRCASLSPSLFWSTSSHSLACVPPADGLRITTLMMTLPTCCMILRAFLNPTR